MTMRTLIFFAKRTAYLKSTGLKLSISENIKKRLKPVSEKGSMLILFALGNTVFRPILPVNMVVNIVTAGLKDIMLKGILRKILL